MEKVHIKTEFITLGQLIKYVGIVSNGGEVKHFLAENEAIINGLVDQRRGKKLYNGDVVEILDKKIEICSSFLLEERGN